ncbi:MAG: hypothetical protein EBU88_06820 [Acidobacteria bacterium]|nr:hypothetical protein [Acidobacteriota bacterium]
MTRIESTTVQDASLSLYELTGADPERASAVAELVRYLVSSHSPWRYQTLLGEVSRLISPVREIHQDEIRFVLDALESDGDLVVNGGAVHATPIRAIKLDEQNFRFLSSLPTKRLAGLFPGDWICHESMRSCHPGDLGRFGSMLRDRGGVLLTPPEWAGLEFEPLADEPWLQALGERMENEAFPPESQIFSHKMDWQWLKYGEKSLTWEKGLATEGARLWRGINLRGYWVFALTRSGSPIEEPWLRLSRNDAYRAVFAIARLEQISIPVKLELVSGGNVCGTTTLTLPPVLPFAEHRFLTVVASSRYSGPGGSRWKLSESQTWSTVEILERRLGINVPSHSAEPLGQSEQATTA